MATIKDVAKVAGVSVATVSRFLNREAVISEKTAQKVKTALQALDYSPNMLGNSLRKSKTKNILVLLSTLSNQFFSRVLRGIEREARTGQYNILISVTEDNKQLEEKYINLLKMRFVDGVIFLTSTLSGQEITKLSKRYPVVQFESITGSKTSYVSVDNLRAGYDAVTELIRRGHERIAFFGGRSSLYLLKRPQRGLSARLKGTSYPGAGGIYYQ